MIALDTNILVHAHRRGTMHHEQALSLLAALSEGPAPYALFWPSLYEFLRVVTQEILTLDGDFARFSQVASRNPFLS